MAQLAIGIGLLVVVIGWIAWKGAQRRQWRHAIIKANTIHYFAAVKTGMAAAEFARRLGYKYNLPTNLTALLLKKCAGHDDPIRMIMIMITWNVFALQSKAVAETERATNSTINEITKISGSEIRMMKVQAAEFPNDFWFKFLPTEAPPSYVMDAGIDA